MHRVLFIRDLLLDIFEYFSSVPPTERRRHSSPDLAALARTCQTFKEPALDVLWKELFDLSPLARCLPEACSFDEAPYYSFHRPLSTAEWNTLRGYTRRVRFIHHCPTPPCDRRVALFLAPFTDPLFPNLRSLYWDDFESLPMAHIAVPSLTSLSLGFIRTSGPPTMELFDAIGERCPNIRRFSATFNKFEPFGAIISRQLCRWSNLQYLDCYELTLTMDFVLHLPALPTLKRLLFTLSGDLGNHTTHLGSVFVLSNLAELDIGSTSLNSITSFLSRLELPRIKDLDVTVSEYTPRQDVQEYWTTVQRVCPSNGTLTHLALSNYLDDSTEHLHDHHGQRHSCLMLFDLLPYKDFGNLRKMRIDVGWSVNLTDADILDLVSTLPHLEQLSINDSWGWNMDGEGGITLNGLVQLLRQCPSLVNMSLVIDTRTFIQIPHGLDVSFPPRKTSQGNLFLNCMDSHFEPEFDVENGLVFKALKLSVWSFTLDIHYMYLEF